MGNNISVEEFLKEPPKIINNDLFKTIDKKYYEIKNYKYPVKKIKTNLRYIIFNESVSGHCCFGFTVVDTLKKDPWYNNFFSVVCETYEENDAIDICMSLNKINEINNGK